MSVQHKSLPWIIGDFIIAQETLPEIRIDTAKGVGTDIAWYNMYFAF